MKLHSEEILKLLKNVKELYGESSFQYYGSSPEEVHGIGFKLKGIKVTFSVHTRDGNLPPGEYDVHVESIPPGEYLYTDVIKLNNFIQLIKTLSGPESAWPIME